MWFVDFLFGLMVSIHALLRRATGRDYIRRNLRTFQSTPSCGGRPDWPISAATAADGFNPRPPAEGDPLTGKRSGLHPQVSIHALLRRATGISVLPRLILLFQSTPSCGGRHNTPIAGREWANVSIHALLRRATRPTATCWNGRWSFNPRPPAEGDAHYPVNSALPYGFNPRPPAEGDTYCLRFSKTNLSFQSTPSCGGRQVSDVGRVYLRGGFNPRPPAEGDMLLCTPYARLIGFQSTPSCGGRQEHRAMYGSRYVVSIHALLRRATWERFSFRRGS